MTFFGLKSHEFNFMTFFGLKKTKQESLRSINDYTLTLNSGRVISKERSVMTPDGLATLSNTVTNGEFRLRQFDEAIDIPSDHCMSIS